MMSCLTKVSQNLDLIDVKNDLFFFSKKHLASPILATSLTLSQSYCYSELNTNHDDTNMAQREHHAYFVIYLDST